MLVCIYSCDALVNFSDLARSLTHPTSPHLTSPHLTSPHSLALVPSIHTIPRLSYQGSSVPSADPGSSRFLPEASCRCDLRRAPDFAAVQKASEALVCPPEVTLQTLNCSNSLYKKYVRLTKKSRVQPRPLFGGPTPMNLPLQPVTFFYIKISLVTYQC